MSCTCIYPPLEIATLTRGSEKTHSSAPLLSWDEVLQSVDNAALKNFFAKQVEMKQEAGLRHRQLVYRLNDKRRFFVRCRRKYAYVWQRGRFYGDAAYWRKVLSEPNNVQEVNEKRSLRFHLTKSTDFTAFSKTI
jgi:hypothetical protein